MSDIYCDIWIFFDVWIFLLDHWTFFWKMQIYYSWTSRSLIFKAIYLSIYLYKATNRTTETTEKATTETSSKRKRIIVNPEFVQVTNILSFKLNGSVPETNSLWSVRIYRRYMYSSIPLSLYYPSTCPHNHPGFFNDQWEDNKHIGHGLRHLSGWPLVFFNRRNNAALSVQPDCFPHWLLRKDNNLYQGVPRLFNFPAPFYLLLICFLTKKLYI